MSSNVLIDNEQHKIKITETPSQVILTCPTNISDIYGASFGNLVTKQSGLNDIWTFNKNDTVGLKALSAMISFDITTSFKLQQFPMLLQTTPLLTTPTVDPKLIMKIIWKSQDGTVTLVDYTANSMVMFCPREFGKQYETYFKSVGAKLSQGMAQNVERTQTGWGWLFFKNANVYNLLKQLTGVDIESSVVPPEKKKWRNDATVGTILNSPPKNMIQGGLIGTLPLVNPTNNNPHPPQAVNMTPVHHLADILAQLSIPMSTVNSMILTHPHGETRIGYWGPTNLVEKEQKEYLENYSSDIYNTKISITIIIGDNTASIIDRYSNSI